MPKTKKPSPKTDKLKSLKAGVKSKRKTNPKENGETIEPLSNFQKPKTGRVQEETPTDLTIKVVSVENETDYLILDSSQQSNGHVIREGELIYKAAVHKKLKNALQAFAPHLAILANYLNISKMKKIADLDPDLYAVFTVTKIHLKHSKRGDTIQIVGHCKTFREKCQILTTPLENIDSDNENAYEFSDDLISLVDGLKIRVNKYLTGEERGVVQQGLPFPEVESETAILTDGKEHDVTNKY